MSATLDLQGTYATEEEAFAAVERVKQSHGIWPGVIRHQDGSASLMHNAETWEARRDYVAPAVRVKPADTRRDMMIRAIEAGKSAKGGWTRAQLAEWGVPWPPPKGWKEALIAGRPVPVRDDQVPAGDDELPWSQE